VYSAEGMSWSSSALAYSARASMGDCSTGMAWLLAMSRILKASRSAPLEITWGAPMVLSSYRMATAKWVGFMTTKSALGTAPHAVALGHFPLALAHACLHLRVAVGLLAFLLDLLVRHLQLVFVQEDFASGTSTMAASSSTSSNRPNAARDPAGASVAMAAAGRLHAPGIGTVCNPSEQEQRRNGKTGRRSATPSWQW